MTLSWRRLGWILDPTVRDTGLGTHVANPTPRLMGNGVVRIYFGARDPDNRSRIGYVDVSLVTPDEPRILRIAQKPVLEPRAPGYFDDGGVSMGSIVRDDGGAWRLYYVGWNLSVAVPWRNSIGCAVEMPGGPFEPVSPAPVLDRNRYDPFSLSYPWVLRTDSGWRMWYGTNTAWGPELSDMRHVIRGASSGDGFNWIPDPEPAIGLGDDGETAIVRPAVVRDSEGWHMWYSHRSASGYRIGYAHSTDGRHWRRVDAGGGLAPLGEGPETGEVCYPAVFDLGSARYILYNGDGHGRTGFGLAVLDRD